MSAYIEMGGGIAARSARQASATEVIGLIRTSGLRGRGGAGFPTGTKWDTVAASRGNEATAVVVNAAEGEPGTFKDRALLRTNPYRVIEGAIVAATTMQTDQVFIGIKASFGREIDRLSVAIGEMRDAGWLDDVQIDLVLGPSSYLFGEETGMLEVIGGRQPFPRVTPPYRRGLQDGDTRSVVGAHLASVGASSGAPALVDNVETLANVPLIIERGVDWFRQEGTEGSPGTIVCTVSGATRRSGVGEVAMGVTLREAIDLVGWGSRRGRSVQVVLAGTANALIPAGLLDTPLTYEAMDDAGSGLGSAGFIVFDDTADPLAVAAGVARFLAVESCGQCEPCKSDGLAIAEQLRSMREDPTADLDDLRTKIGTVTTGARCNLAQQQASVAASLLDLFPPSHSSRLGRDSSIPAEPEIIAPLADLVGGRAVLDPRQRGKQPDWSYDRVDSGATPAALLGNTPVHITRPIGTLRWPEGQEGDSTEEPLGLIDDAHEAIDELISSAVAGDDQDVVGRVDDLGLAIRTHIDITQRVLYPMVRRVGGEEGELLADAAEHHERALLRLVDQIDREAAHRHLRDIGGEMHTHAHLEDEVIALLRHHLDPIERSNLADGLAAARATSTVSLLHRTATTAPASASRLSRPRPVVANGAPARPPEPALEPRSARTPALPGSAIQKVLVGVDGSPAASSALGWAGRLAARIGAEVVVSNVFEPEQAEISPDDFERLFAEVGRRLDTEWSEALRGTGVSHHGLQLVGAPDRLLESVEAEGADLLVVGPRGAGRFASLHLGSLAHHLAHRTRGPLAIVPATGATAGIDRILVAVDGSPGSTTAVDWCADLASATGAEVITEVTRSASAVVDTAAATDVGLLVVGTQGINQLTHRRLGHLPLHLVHHTNLPVILVPPLGGDADQDEEPGPNVLPR